MKVITLPIMAIQENVYIYYDEETKKGVIFDIGKDLEVIEKTLQENEIELQAIILTHGHYDHIGGVIKFNKRHNLKVYGHKDEIAVFNNAKYNFSETQLHKPIELIPDVLLEDGDLLDFDTFKLKVIHTKGHTVGSACYLDEENKNMFTGDTLFKMAYGRVDLHTSSNDIKDSIVNKLFVLDDDVVVYPGHGEATNIAFERKNNYIHKFKA